MRISFVDVPVDASVDASGEARVGAGMAG